MELLKEFMPYLAPLVSGSTLILYMIVRSLQRKAKRNEEANKQQTLDLIRVEGYMVKYCGLPIEIFLQDLKAKEQVLTFVADDDILTQILDKKVGI